MYEWYLYSEDGLYTIAIINKDTGETIIKIRVQSIIGEIKRIEQKITK